jgi:hypothetical protein
MSTEAGRAPALKEWAVICHALLEGEQIIDLRKGGLHEDGRHFGVASNTAWLYPTVEHQRAELLRPAYRHWMDLAAGAPVGGPITLHGWVDIVETAVVSEDAQLEPLLGKVIWTGDYAASRLKWKSRDPLTVLVCRAYRLDEPITVEWSDDYGGCTSWVNLAGVPDNPHTLASEPALTDTAFAARLKGAREALAEPTH